MYVPTVGTSIHSSQFTQIYEGVAHGYIVPGTILIPGTRYHVLTWDSEMFVSVRNPTMVTRHTRFEFFGKKWRLKIIAVRRTLINSFRVRHHTVQYITSTCYQVQAREASSNLPLVVTTDTARKKDRYRSIERHIQLFCLFVRTSMSPQTAKESSATVRWLE